MAHVKRIYSYYFDVDVVNKWKMHLLFVSEWHKTQIRSAGKLTLYIIAYSLVNVFVPNSGVSHVSGNVDILRVSRKLCSNQMASKRCVLFKITSVSLLMKQWAYVCVHRCSHSETSQHPWLSNFRQLQFHQLLSFCQHHCFM